MTTTSRIDHLRQHTARRAALVCGTLLMAALSGCNSEPKVDVSKGDYGKAGTETQLPPQPNVQDVIKAHQHGPCVVPTSGNVPAKGSSTGQ